MARTKQRLINYHGSNRSDDTIQAGLLKGEIAVLHGANAAGTMLGTLDDASNLVWFISSAAVYTAIEDVATGGSSQVTALAEKVTGLSATTIIIENNLGSVSAATAPMLTAVTMSTPETGAVTGNYIGFTTAITGNNYEKVETIGTKLDVIQTASALSAVTATGQVADALAIRQYVEGVDTAIQGQLTTVNSNISTLSSSTVNLKELVDYGFNGLTIDSENSVKTYVDSKIGQAVSSAYVVKGTKATYAELTALTEHNTGDVWNVTEAGTSAQTPDHKVHSEGTNWVWTGTEWDALGGTVDLTNYITRDEYSPIAAKANSALQSISGYSSNAYITLTNNSVSSFTVTENASTDLSTVSATGTVADAKAAKDYTDAAKNAAVTSAYTAASALTDSVKTAIDDQISGLGTRVTNIENSNVYNSAVTAVTFDSVADVTYIPENETNHTEAMRHQSGVNASIANKTITFDFDTLVIDCGTF